MRILISFCLFLVALDSMLSQPNCYQYKSDSLCYAACEEAMHAIQHSQGSSASQKHFDQSLAWCDGFAYSWREKAVPYLKRGLFVEWRKMIDRAVELEPKNYLEYRGWCRYQFLRDYEGAIEDIERLDSLVDYDIGVCQNGDYHLQVALALAYKGLGNLDKALDLIDAKLNESDYDPKPFDYFHKGVIHWERKETDLAKSALFRQMEINDYLADTYYYLALIAQSEGSMSEAMAWANKALTFYQKDLHLNDFYTHHMDAIYQVQIERLLAELQ